MVDNNSSNSGYRVYRSGNNIIYTGKISKEGCAEFHRLTLDCVNELDNAVNELDKKKLNRTIYVQKKPPVITGVPPGCVPPGSTTTKDVFSPPVGPNPEPDLPPSTVFHPNTHPNTVDTAPKAEETSTSYTTSIADGSTISTSMTDSMTDSMADGNGNGNGGGSFMSENGSAKSIPAGSGSSRGGSRDVINFHFTSAGGNLPAGIAMMDAVTDASKRYETRCYSKGFVGSACTFPAFACHKRYAPEHTLFLLHPPSKSGISGQTEDLQIHSENLDMWHETSLNIYKKLVRFGPNFGGIAAGVNAAVTNAAINGNGGNGGNDEKIKSTAEVVGSDVSGGMNVGGVKVGPIGSNTTGVSAPGAATSHLVAGAVERIKQIFKDNRYSLAKDVKEMGLIDEYV